MTPSPYALTFFERIKKKNKTKKVTVNSLMENKTYKATAKISNAIKELRGEGLITIRSVIDYGRFETELIFDGCVEHNKNPAIFERDEGSEPESEISATPRRKYIKRTVRRSAI